MPKKTITFTSLLCTCLINIVKSRIKSLLIELLQYTMIKTGRYFKHQPVATLCFHFWMLLPSHPSRAALLGWAGSAAGGLIVQGHLQVHLVSIVRALILADVHQILAWLHTGGQIKLLSQTSLNHISNICYPCLSARTYRPSKHWLTRGCFCMNPEGGSSWWTDAGEF